MHRSLISLRCTLFFPDLMRYIKSLIIVCISLVPAQAGIQFNHSGCPINVLGHDRQGECYSETVDNLSKIQEAMR